MIPKNYTNVGLLALAMIMFTTGSQVLITNRDWVTSLIEIGVGILFLIVREVAKKFGDDI